MITFYPFENNILQIIKLNQLAAVVDEGGGGSGGDVTWATLSGKPVGVAVADATSAEDIVAQFNALLASLRTAGFIAA